MVNLNKDPVVVASMQTHNGSDTAGLRIKELTSIGFKVKVEEEQSADVETWNTNEVVGYLSLEPGNLRLFGLFLDE